MKQSRVFCGGNAQFRYHWCNDSPDDKWKTRLTSAVAVLLWDQNIGQITGWLFARAAFFPFGRMKVKLEYISAVKIPNGSGGKAIVFVEKPWVDVAITPLRFSFEFVYAKAKVENATPYRRLRQMRRAKTSFRKTGIKTVAFSIREFRE